MLDDLKSYSNLRAQVIGIPITDARGGAVYVWTATRQSVPPWLGHSADSSARDVEILVDSEQEEESSRVQYLQHALMQLSESKILDSVGGRTPALYFLRLVRELFAAWYAPIPSVLKAELLGLIGSILQRASHAGHSDVVEAIWNEFVSKILSDPVFLQVNS